MKRIGVATAFHKGDWQLAVRLYRRAKSLGGLEGRSVRLITDSDTPSGAVNAVVLAARSAGGRVTLQRRMASPKPAYPSDANQCFGMAASWASKENIPFLWLEPDTALIKSGWIDELESEYESSGNPYMGGVVAYGEPARKMMWGVGVYPENCIEIWKRLCQPSPQIPFDKAMSVETVKDCHESNLFQFVMGPRGKPTRISTLEHLWPQTVLLHQDKFGDLERLMSAKDKNKSGVVTSRLDVSHTDSDIGVVITTHNRKDCLRAAIESCRVAGIGEIVLVATGYSQDDLNEIQATLNDRERMIVPKSDESNAAWLEGVRALRSPWCQILHDDDRLSSGYIQIVSKAKPSTFVLSNATFHNADGTLLKATCDGPLTEPGNQPTGPLREFLTTRGKLAITPVRGLFKTRDVAAWLQHAGTALAGEYEYRKGFMVGNDLWLFLRAAYAYDSLQVVCDRPVSLGQWEKSTTIGALKDDSAKRLISFYDRTRDAFEKAVRRVEVAVDIPIHILTIVRDGAPFLMGQLQCFNRLRTAWRWSIVHGTALPVNCTSWCKELPDDTPSDDTMSILSDLESHHHIRVLRRDRWRGKLEMVNAPLDNKLEVLVQIDCDEFWTAEQLERMRLLFIREPRSHAMFWCRYFVGPDLIMTGRNCYANNPQQEWRRAWLKLPHHRFTSHEPPLMCGDQSRFYTHDETEAEGLVFDHYSYALRSQVRFKEVYYGYANAVEQWQALQSCQSPERLEKHFSWAKGGGVVTRV